MTSHYVECPRHDEHIGAHIISKIQSLRIKWVDTESGKTGSVYPSIIAIVPAHIRETGSEPGEGKTYSVDAVYIIVE